MNSTPIGITCQIRKSINSLFSKLFILFSSVMMHFYLYNSIFHITKKKTYLRPQYSNIQNINKYTYTIHKSSMTKNKLLEWSENGGWLLAAAKKRKKFSVLLYIIQNIYLIFSFVLLKQSYNQQQPTAYTTYIINMYLYITRLK